MKIFGSILVMAAFAVIGGCAKPDWIERTLVTVDVTGTWHGFGGEEGSARARLCSTLSNRDQR